MLSANEILTIIELCSKRGVTKFKAGTVEFTLLGHREPGSQTSQLLDEMHNDQEWLTQNIPAGPLPEVE